MAEKSDVRPGAKMLRLQRMMDNPTPLLRRVGVVMLSHSQRAFREQGLPGAARWEPRRVPNVMGIVADFAAGKSAPPARRFDARPVLMDTRRLSSSLSYRIVGNDSVEVGSNLPYAGTHQAGGRSESARMNLTMQKAIAKWLAGAGKQWRAKLGWLLSPNRVGKKIVTKVPARPFVGLTPALQRDIRSAIGDAIFEGQ